jgi:hypothetical protein
MKKRHLLIFLIVLSFLCIGLIIVIRSEINKYNEDFEIGQKTRVAEESRILQEISANTGIDPSWLALREFIFCNSLHKGMKRIDVEKNLSRISKISPGETEIDFVVPIIQSHLGPVMVIFDSPGPNGELLRWSRSPEQNLGQPLAECEKKQKMYNAP